MDNYLPEFAGTYLEDSYFLGAVTEGSDLRLKVLFALTTDNARYARPKLGEQHCYCEGSIVVQQPSVIEWHAGKPTLTRDLDGTLDFGGLELYRSGPSRFRFVTEWFDVTVETVRVAVELSEGNVR